MFIYVGALLVAFCVSIFALRRQLALEIAVFPIIMILYFLTTFYIFEVAHEIPIFILHYERGEEYLYALIVITLYPAGILLGFSIPARLSGMRFNTRHVINSAISNLRMRNVARRSVFVELSLFFVGIVPVLIILIFADTSDLYIRDTFPLRSIDGFAMGLADTLFWVSLIAIPIIKNRALKYFSLLALIIVFAAAGERQAFVAPVVFVFFERAVFGRKSFGHIFLIACSFWLLAVLIYLRYQWLGGLKYVSLLFFSFDGDVIGFLVFSVNYMSVFSVVTVSEAMIVFGEDWRAFWYAINPLPSSFADGQREFLNTASLRPNVPYSGLAMMHNHLNVVGVVGVGFVVGLVGFISVLLSPRVNALSVLLLLTFLMVPYIFSLQYNLRAFSRLIYFSGFIFVSYQLLFRRLRFNFLGMHGLKNV
ncbi:hypothetical protein [Roseinatronobacter alkalisoli]|uniref:Oligosaccharide repeat unit polymerase n=1 Tax=Roseinatronobacter alkalisoli TaxID=3028235 RepID=A0ABT5TA59_9RHOB|nr:hypothetical protein [Roseinatronobacter sp. HJB301]MDD7971982.1 hypothetical protein [Roseinatronobacter sp. HJB301]